MTRQDMREFAEKQVAWYTKMVEADKRHIEWLGREIVRSRKEDKEQKEWAKTYNNGEFAHLYEGHYESKETKKLLNERRRYQRNLKKYEAMLVKYTNEVTKYTDHEEIKEEETMETKTTNTIPTTTENKEETAMKTTNTKIDLTAGTVTFELNGITYKWNPDTNRYSKTENGKTTRIGYVEYSKAHFDFQQSTLDNQPSKTEVENDLEKPANLDEFGCVDCSKCNVEKCVHRDCMRRNPKNVGGLGECPRLDNGIVGEAEKMAEETGIELAEAELAVNVEKAKKTPRKPRKSKDIAFVFTPIGDDSRQITLTAKQVDFLQELTNTDLWDGFDTTIWTDILCDEIGGQFEDKPMTVGAMISTLCEKGLAERGKGNYTDPVTNRTRKSTYMAFTGLGEVMMNELGLC